jgi:hypothetical protein
MVKVESRIRVPPDVSERGFVHARRLVQPVNDVLDGDDDLSGALIQGFLDRGQ